jgi:hypothetical protein
MLDDADRASQESLPKIFRCPETALFGSNGASFAGFPEQDPGGLANRASPRDLPDGKKAPVHGPENIPAAIK